MQPVYFAAKHPQDGRDREHQRGEEDARAGSVGQKKVGQGG